MLTNNAEKDIINKKNGGIYMKPRVFVSSTFYDLKYVREDLASFIRNHDFEPIMFEDGDIGYDTNKALDESCYEAMHTADMAVLIIGGQYGSNASSQESEIVDSFISITQREFETAVKDNIPVFAFVDTKVLSEYNIYKSNMEKFERNPKYIEFHATKDVRIFKFIHSIFCPNMIPVNEFTKISDIKDFLSKQWSDMFKKYLKQCKEDKEIETIKTSIAKLESIVNSMTVMLDAVGKNVLKETPNEYNVIKEKQQVTEICNMIKDAVSFEDRADKSSQSPLPNRLIGFIFDVNKYISSVRGADQDAEYARNETYGHSRFIEHVRNLGMRKDLFVFFVDSEAIPNICENLNNERIKKLVAEELSNTDFSFKRKIRFRA